MPRSTCSDERAIVDPRRASQHFTYDNWLPDPPLDAIVRRHWSTEWELAEPFVQPIVGHPATNLVVQADGSAMVTGPCRDNDLREISGRGWAAGLLFRPAGFRCLVSVPMDELRDRRVPASELFGAAAAADLVSAVHAAPDALRRAAVMSTWLDARLPGDLGRGPALSDVIDLAVGADPPVTSVAVLAAMAGTSPRTLERWFRDLVGVGPKWVLDRLRLHAAAGVASEPVESWAEVAHRLGYADQSHLSAAFRSSYGAPPARYSRALRGG